MKVLRNLKELETEVKTLREKGLKIVFTNGCFDILHAGHADYLERAKSFGDFLIVGMNSDSSIKRIKGEKRPIVNEEMRAKLLSSLRAVDLVFIFDQETPLDIIKVVRPDVLVKGADWPLEKIVGREFASRVERIPFKFNVSTTKVVERILSLYCKHPL